MQDKNIALQSNPILWKYYQDHESYCPPPTKLAPLIKATNPRVATHSDTQTGAGTPAANIQSVDSLSG